MTSAVGAPPHASSAATLNAAQRAAVDHADGPLLVLAGAGSGKTRVITHRVARLLRQGVAPRTILAVTFTNKAAREMQERVEAMAGQRAHGVTIATFHALGARLIREQPSRFGLRRAFTIYDDDDQTATLRDVLERRALAHDAPALRSRRAFIEAAKNLARTPLEVHEDARGPAGEEDATVFEAYEQALRAANACDFADLIALPVIAMRTDAGYRDALRARFEHLLVDEFQDTNGAQFELVRLIAGTDVVAVGDDDQAIYGWRGASVANVRRFLDELPGATVVALEENYRSAPTILEAAHGVVERLPGRLPKRLSTARSDRPLIDVFVGDDDREEAAWVARQVKTLFEAGVTPPQIAVFFRVNAQSRSIEEGLRHAGIDYELVGGVSWFDRREVRDLVAFLRLSVNGVDEAAFRRVANVPPRGIGARTLRSVIDTRAVTEAPSFAVAARAVADAMRGSSRSRGGLVDLANLLDDLEAIARDGTAAEVLGHVISRTRYEAHLTASDPVSGEERVQNVREFVESAASAAAGGAGDVVAYLEALALRDAAASGGDVSESRGLVQLMTVHAAKGLEFDAVFVTGLEDRQFPLVRQDEGGDPDEERRLCYVAFTRARHRLFASGARRRRLYGQTREMRPSPFLVETSRGLLRQAGESVASIDGWHKRDEVERERPRLQRAWDDFDQRPAGERVPEAGLIFDDATPRRAAAASDASLVGATVRHKLFGDGVVRGVEGDGPKARLTIEFSGATTKSVVRAYVEIVRR